MKDFLDKISSYHLFNYLLPGVLFCVVARGFTQYSLLTGDLFLDGFVSYFVGLTVSRVGSLLIEPILKRVAFVRFADYRAFVDAEKKDPQLAILSETNNMYRTLLSGFLLLLLLRGYQALAARFEILASVQAYVLISLLALLFLWAYRKQTSYIRNRVTANNP